MQPIHRVILATLPTMVALLGFMWFRRKKKDVPMIKDKCEDEKVSKKVSSPGKANNNTPEAHSQAKEKHIFAYTALEENIISLSPVGMLQDAPLNYKMSETKVSEKSLEAPVALSSASQTVTKVTAVETANEVQSISAQAHSSHQSADWESGFLPSNTVVTSIGSDAESKIQVETSDITAVIDAEGSDKTAVIDAEGSDKTAVLEAEASDEVKSSGRECDDDCDQTVEPSMSALPQNDASRSAMAQNDTTEQDHVDSNFHEPLANAYKNYVASPVSESEPLQDAEGEPLQNGDSEYLQNGSDEFIQNGENDLQVKDDWASTEEAPESTEQSCHQSGASYMPEHHSAAIEEPQAASHCNGSLEVDVSSFNGSPSHCGALDRNSAGDEATDMSLVNDVDQNGHAENHNAGGVEQHNGIHSDTHSEVSSDSGKGNSVGETPQPTSPTVDVPEYTMYEFDFPSNLCGRLIGRMGKNINSIKTKTGADIFLKRKPFVRDYQICCIQGTHSQVNAALAQIKKRFPSDYYEDITYEQLNSPLEHSVLPPEIMQLSLPEGVSVDVIVSSVVDVNHVFIQQPTHPTYSCLERLNFCMNACYGQDTIVPQLPRPIEVGVICAAPIFNGWYRAQVVDSHPDIDEYDIKFVDYGGYVRVQGCQLRQIRSDFTTLPFQAVECYLANVVPPEGQDAFPAEASPMLESLVQGKILQAQIVTHEEDGVPYVQLYELHGDQAVFINRELVNQNVAQWIEYSS